MTDGRDNDEIDAHESGSSGSADGGAEDEVSAELGAVASDAEQQSWTNDGESGVDAPAEDASTPQAATEEPEDPQRSVKRDLSAIEAMLRKTRRDLALPVFAEGFAWVCAALGAVVISALLAGLATGEHGPLVARAILAVSGSAVGLGGSLALFGFVRRRPSLDDVARDLQRHVPQFRNDVVAALQFGRALAETEDPSSLGYSPSLAAGHVRRTARALLGAADGNGSLANWLPSRSPTPVLMGLAAATVLLLAVSIALPERVAVVMRGAMGLAVDGEESDVQLRPIVGDIDLLHGYPRYTELQPRFEPFTSGQIETLVGTEVTIKTYPLIAASRYEIVLRGKDGVRPIALEESRGRLSATLFVLEPGTYRFRAVLADGSTLEDGIDRPITVHPDSIPEINVTSHESEIEVSPDEVLELNFAASDDFGIDSVAYSYSLFDEPPTVVPVQLPELASTPERVTGKFQLDLSSLSLQPKDVVTLHLEARDNNTLTGPGLGKSPPMILRVASPEDRHMRLIAEEQEVLQKLLQVLADFLENPVGERRRAPSGKYRQYLDTVDSSSDWVAKTMAIEQAHRREAEVLVQMGSLAQSMNEDPLMTARDLALFEGLYKQLYALNRDGEEVLNGLRPRIADRTIGVRHVGPLADYAAESEDVLEKGLLRLDELLAAQKLDAVEGTRKEIDELKDRLRELLERYRETKDPELKETIMREIRRLQQRINELLARMQSQIKELPQEHVNMEALEQAKLESEVSELTNVMQDIEKLLDAGDIDGALEAIDKMSAQLDSLTGEMNDQLAAAQPQGLSELDQKVSELMDLANDIEQEQAALEDDTAELQAARDAEERRRVEQMLESQTRDLAKLVERQRELVGEMVQRDLAPHDLQAAQAAKQQLEQLERMLEAKDIEQARESAERAQNELRSLEFSLQMSERYTDPESGRGKAVRQTRRDAESAMPRQKRINEQLDKIMDQATKMRSRTDSAATRELALRQRTVDQHAQQLAEKIGETGERFPVLEEQLRPGIEKTRESMQGSEGALREDRTQRSLDHQRTALERLRELKQSMRNTLERKKSQGSRSSSGQEKVVIPDEDGRNAGEFRDAVRKAMKDARPEDYAEEIERYYKALAE